MTEAFVRHPAPAATESLQGYLIRLAEENGYAGPGVVLRLAGITSSVASFSDRDFEILAAAIGQPLESILALRFQGTTGLQLLGAPVAGPDLRFDKARVCPHCVAELGFIEAHWHLDLFVACPRHRSWATYFCGSCRKPLKWSRHGLLICSCGAPVHTSVAENLEDHEVELLDIIRFRVYGDRSYAGDSAGLPRAALLLMSLTQMLSVIRSIGKYAISKNAKPNHYGREMVLTAARVLQNWPENYVRLLTKLNPKLQRGAIPIPENLCAIPGQLALAKWDCRLTTTPL